MSSSTSVGAATGSPAARAQWLLLPALVLFPWHSHTFCDRAVRHIKGIRTIDATAQTCTEGQTKCLAMCDVLSVYLPQCFLAGLHARGRRAACLPANHTVFTCADPQMFQCSIVRSVCLCSSEVLKTNPTEFDTTIPDKEVGRVESQGCDSKSTWQWKNMENMKKTSFFKTNWRRRREQKDRKQVKHMKSEKNLKNGHWRDSSGATGRRSSRSRKTRIPRNTPSDTDDTHDTTASHARHGTRSPGLSITSSQPPIEKVGLGACVRILGKLIKNRPCVVCLPVSDTFGDVMKKIVFMARTGHALHTFEISNVPFLRRKQAKQSGSPRAWRERPSDGLGVERSIRERNGTSPERHLLHGIRIRDDTVLNGMLPCQHTALGSSASFTAL